MTLSVNKALMNEKEILSHLLQLYMYDFTEFTNAAINPDGLYFTMSDFDSYWLDPVNNHAFIIREDQEIIGFAFVKQLEIENRSCNYLAQFFILRKFRRSGMGRKAAKMIIDLFKGEWELYQLENNCPAQNFWDKVISKVSISKCTERREMGRRYQTFQGSS